MRKRVYTVILGLSVGSMAFAYTWNTQGNIGISKVLTVNSINASNQHGYSSSSTPLLLSLQEYYQFPKNSVLNNLWVGGGAEYSSIQNYNFNGGYQQMYATVPIFAAARLNANVSGSALNPYLEGRVGLNAPLASQMAQPVGIGGYAGLGVGISQNPNYQQGFNFELLFEISQIIMQNQSLFTTKIGATLGYNFSV